MITYRDNKSKVDQKESIEDKYSQYVKKVADSKEILIDEIIDKYVITFIESKSLNLEVQIDLENDDELKKILIERFAKCGIKMTSFDCSKKHTLKYL